MNILDRTVSVEMVLLNMEIAVVDTNGVNRVAAEISRNPYGFV
jgi:hypothetical protein